MTAVKEVHSKQFAEEVQCDFTWAEAAYKFGGISATTLWWRRMYLWSLNRTSIGLGTENSSNNAVAEVVYVQCDGVPGHTGRGSTEFMEKLHSATVESKIIFKKAAGTFA